MQKMWKCHKCGKPVYFAERKQSLGYDWHPECLRCEECCKRLNPGQHAEHKGVPYCHVPCYGALFGPQLFGHGTRVESHTSFGKVENRTGCSNLPRSHLESKLKVFNQYYDGKSGEIRSREVNGRLVLEGALRICWGVMNMIHLKEDDDQRTVVTIRKRNSYRSTIDNGYEDDLNDDDVEGTSTDDSGKPASVFSDQQSSTSSGTESTVESRSATLPSKLELKEWDELDELLQVERQETNYKLYQTLPSSLISTRTTDSVTDNIPPVSPEVNKPTPEQQSTLQPTNSESNSSGHSIPNFFTERRTVSLIEGSYDGEEDSDDNIPVQTSLTSPEDEGPRQGRRQGCTAIRRRPGRRRSRTKLKRRCSINGHFYNRETSFFLPPHGSLMSVWVTSLVSTYEVINLMLEKYKVDSPASKFALFVVRDNGEQRRLREDEYPLLVRVMLGPHEEVSKLFLMDAQCTEEISSEVAQFLNLSTTECRAILERYCHEEERQVKRIRAKYREMRRRIKQRMEDLKVRL